MNGSNPDTILDAAARKNVYSECHFCVLGTNCVYAILDRRTVMAAACGTRVCFHHHLVPCR